MVNGGRRILDYPPPAISFTCEENPSVRDRPVGAATATGSHDTVIVENRDPDFADGLMNARSLTAGKSWSLPDIRGHDVEVSIWFLGIVAFFILMPLRSFEQLPYQVMWAPVLFFSILLHELGHAAATKKLGFGTSKIILHGFGGVAMNRRGHTPPKKGMYISLAGPAVTLVLAVIFGGLWFGYRALVGVEVATALDAVGYFLGLMAAANVVWFILNMLPIYPLDGGQTMMHYFRKKGAGSNEATAKAAKVSLATIGGVGLLFLVASAVLPIRGFLVLIIFGFLGYMNWKVLQRAKQGGAGPGGPGGGFMIQMPRK